jgi:hypothetical protein
LLGLFGPEDGSDISQKIVFFITAAVRTSNPKYQAYLVVKVERMK